MNTICRRSCPAVLLALALAGPLGAQPAHVPYAPAAVRTTDPAVAREVVAFGYDVDHVDPEHVHLYLTQEEFDALAARGYDIVWIPDEAALMWKELTAGGTRTGKDATGYRSYADITAELQTLAAAHPQLMRVASIGKSVQNRELWMVRITDNPDIEEDEPEVRYSSTMHGDEPVGTEILFDLMHRLLENHGTDERLTNIVNETDIWILPLMNPDGWSGAPPTRYNTNNVDLNRNFPSWVCSNPNATAGRQAETAAMMNWTAGRFPVLAANFHGGALVVNYPFDECPTCNNFTCTSAISPDDDVFQAASLAYSLPNARMAASSVFPNGITNGVAWYPLYGGMQDWSYRWMGCMEVTIELDDQKIPASTRLPSIIAENRESLLAYVEWAHRGVRGIVTDSVSGLPLAARVTVEGRAFTTFTDPAVGDYHRLLTPGTYALTFAAAGHEPRTITDVEVTSGSATRLDVTLKPLTRGWVVR